MRALHFYAAAGTPHPAVLSAFEAQAHNALRPFNRYLGQAIHTAKQRQIRYELPWERVRNQLTIGLRPLDTALRVPRRPPGAVLEGWPADKQWDLSERGFVMNRAKLLRVQAATRTGAGLVVWTEPPLEPGDDVIWCGGAARAMPGPEPQPPSRVADRRGQALTLASTPRAEKAYWALVVHGRVDERELIVDGEEMEVEALPPTEGLTKVRDAKFRSFEVSHGTLREDEAPAEGPLLGDDGVRYQWELAGAPGRQGCWIQLLPPESSDGEEFLDPRAAFCEGEVSEVWTQPRRREDSTYRVRRVDQDRYQLLLDRFPPERSSLFLPLDLRNLYLQKRALRQLAEAPLPHHQGLLRLCEDPGRARWPPVQPVTVPEQGWRALSDASRSGTDEQRSFVAQALGSPDFAFLEGPPGSGKTTAICEIVQQLVARGERVLLCASTHVAIDNVLERLHGVAPGLDAVRIGKLDRVDDRVQSTQIDERVGALVRAWRQQPGMQQHGDAVLGEMAERTVLMAANLTCGTTMGIVSHPLFRGRDEDRHIAERPITTMPHWDVLIVDEASKTLIQEFLVPALMARRWIVVGDVHQLPPFTERADIVANLRDLVDEHDKPVFQADHQRACLLMYRLLRLPVRQRGMRWLLVEPPGVLEWIARELEAEPVAGLSVARVVATKTGSIGAVDCVTCEQLCQGAPEALRLAAADWVLIGEDLIAKVADLLPANLLSARELCGSGGPLTEGDALLLRQAWFLQRADRLERSYFERKFRREEIVSLADARACEADWLRRNDLAQELAWRLTRLHELRHSGNEEERKRLRRDLERLRPRAANIDEPLAEIEDVGLPSILEVLQEGIGADRSKRKSALTLGLRSSRPEVFDARFRSLSFQHRMHPDIAAFSRDIIYRGSALRDANTIRIRDETLGWDFGGFRARRVWLPTSGEERGGVNQAEIRAMEDLLRGFIAWAQRKGAPRRGPAEVWEVACLSFYTKQERAISDMLRGLTGDDRKTRFRARDAPVEIVCATVDRFQGREADLVLLSLRNTGRTGFLDSPNRLNVAVTRARQQLVVIGNHPYFQSCRVSELEALARQTPELSPQELQRWRSRSR